MQVEIIDAPGHGGARKGAGRKPAGYEKPPEKVQYDEWKARSERATALQRELDLKVNEGKYVARDAVVQATATAYASVAQTLRSIPDHLERRLGIAPELAEEIAKQIDETLSTLADEFELMGGGSAD